MVIGNAEKFKTRSQALKAADGCRLKASRESEEARGSTFGALIESYITEERLREAKDRAPGIGVVEGDEEFDAEALSYSTASSYLSMLDVHIRPRWGKCPIPEVKPAKVQEWLRGLDMAPKTKGHIKALMHRLFEKAMLWELVLFDRNPMELVEVKGISKRSKKPIVLDADQCVTLVSSIPEPYRTMVLVAICT
jgi:hypothetical protein